MKVNLSNFNKFDGFSSQKRALGSGTSCKNDEQAHYKKGAHKFKEDNSIDLKRPAESVSFSGSVSSDKDKEKDSSTTKIALAVGAGIAAAAAGIYTLSKNSDKITEKLAKSKTFHKMAYYSEDNEAKVKALLALGLAGILKPICVLAMPGAEEEDKQFTATKNALSAFIGYLLSCAIFNPISSGVNEFLSNTKEYLPENNWLVKTFEEESKKGFSITPSKEMKRLKAEAIKNKEKFYVTDMKPAFKTVYKNGLGVLVAPAKAALTIALMPFVLKVVFGNSKGRKKLQEQEQKPIPVEILHSSTLSAINTNTNNIDKIFDSFTKGGFQK